MKYSKVIIMIIKYSLYLLWFHFGSSLPKFMWNLIAHIMMRFGGNFKRPLVHEGSALMKGLKQSCRSEWVLISREMKLITMRMDCYKAMPLLLMFCVFHKCFRNCPFCFSTMLWRIRPSTESVRWSYLSLEFLACRFMTWTNLFP